MVELMLVEKVAHSDSQKMQKIINGVHNYHRPKNKSQANEYLKQDGVNEFSERIALFDAFRISLNILKTKSIHFQELLLIITWQN